MKRRSSEAPKMDTGRWLTTYADLMNNLLVFFIMLYMFSVMDMEKFQKLMESFERTFPSSSSPEDVPADISDIYIEPTESDTNDTSNTDPSDLSLEDLDMFVQKISTIIKAKGYSDQIIVERVDEYIYFRFKDGVLFQPDLAILKKDSYQILDFVSDILYETYPEIMSIEIAGHTAWVPSDDINTNFNSWELSADRSMTVLKYLVANCGLPKDKMTVMGYSSTQPYKEGDSEEIRTLNRRVEIRISRALTKKANSD